MTLKLNGTTSGSVSLDAPATGSDVSLTLPTFGFGKVLQVVQGSTSTSTSNATTSYIDTNLSASITPSSTSSKILVLVAQNGLVKSNGNVGNELRFKLMRDATTLYTQLSIGYTGTALDLYLSTWSYIHLDSPNTTSSVTYKTTFANGVAANVVLVQSGGNATSTITLIEVGP